MERPPSQAAVSIFRVCCLSQSTSAKNSHLINDHQNQEALVRGPVTQVTVILPHAFHYAIRKNLSRSSQKFR